MRDADWSEDRETAFLKCPHTRRLLPFRGPFAPTGYHWRVDSVLHLRWQQVLHANPRPQTHLPPLRVAQCILPPRYSHQAIRPKLPCARTKRNLICVLRQGGSDRAIEVHWITRIPSLIRYKRSEPWPDQSNDHYHQCHLLDRAGSLARRSLAASHRQRSGKPRVPPAASSIPILSGLAKKRV